MSAPAVVVHSSLDLDAVACIVAAGAEESFATIPAHATRLPDHLAGSRVLDHPLGEKGRLDEDGRRHAAVLSMPEASGWDQYLLAEIDDADRYGRTAHRGRFSLGQVFHAIRRDVLDGGLEGRDADEEIVRCMGRVIRGLVETTKARDSVVRKADAVEIVDVGRFRAALVPVGRLFGLNGALARRGAACGVYFRHDSAGWQMGVTRWPGFDEPDLRRLEPRLPGWFVHPAGYLACWGSGKGPRHEPPPEGTPRTQQELLALLREVFAGEGGGR